MESHFEYGLRSGIWRIFNVLDKYKIKATFSCCSQALEKSPWLVNEILKRGHEISAHGVKWISHANLNVNEEEKVIRRMLFLNKPDCQGNLQWGGIQNLQLLLIQEIY